MKVISTPKHNDRICAKYTMYPSHATFYEKDATFGQGTNTCYGVVLEGAAKINANGQDWHLVAGNFFALHGHCDMTMLAENTKVWVVERFGFRCLPMVGQLEENGRLSYIDGCSDTVLVPMPRMGDPVLNYLHFPDGILQTQHTHPSIRFGLVVKGSGVAWQEKSGTKEGWEIPLTPGCMFLLPEQELHSFKTNDCEMDIVAFHPDSDTGPTDENHAMINRMHIDHGK
jgi:quercetin dioxygenase-like cupin family protein